MVAWWGVYHSPQSAANLEKKLTETAQKALNAEGMDWANVKLDGQVAKIAGVAPSLDAGRQAAEIVLTSAGPGGPILGGISSVSIDGISEAPPVSPYKWRASKNGAGDWLLSGHVPSGAIREHLLQSAKKSASGKVLDRMQLAAGVPQGNWQGVASVGIEQLSKLESGEISLVDTTLSVQGVTANTVLRSRVEKDISRLAAPYRGKTIIEGESRWFARHDAGTLVLSGKVGSEAERAEILEIAQSSATKPIDDQMEVSTLSPDDWMEGIRTVLPHFAKFQSGRFSYDALRKGLNITGSANSSTLAYLREDLDSIAGLFDVGFLAEPVEIDVGEISGLDFDADPFRACERGFAAVLEANTVNFATSSAEITRDSGITLDKLLAVAQRCSSKLNFEVGGHTDSVGDRGLNIELSDARAQSVADYLATAGVAPERMDVVGYGPDVPVADNGTAEGRAQNRRIEFKITERSE